MIIKYNYCTIYYNLLCNPWTAVCGVAAQYCRASKWKRPSFDIDSGDPLPENSSRSDRLPTPKNFVFFQIYVNINRKFLSLLFYFKKENTSKYCGALGQNVPGLKPRQFLP